MQSQHEVFMTRLKSPPSHTDIAPSGEIRLAGMNTFKEIISGKKRGLSQQVEEPLAKLAEACRDRWNNVDRLDVLLQQHFALMPASSRLYVVDRYSRQHSSTVMAGFVDVTGRGRDLSGAANLASTLPYKGMCLATIQG
jgi:hypothetical protein